jgi:cytochrome b
VSSPDPILTWDWPHRIWHWTFAACLCVSLYTGFDGGIGAMDLHITSGVTILGLLAFRFGWALWGGSYVRAQRYRTSPSAILRHFRGGIDRAAVHSAPAVAMAWAVFAVVLLQATTGLFASDDIVTEGPLAHRVSSASVDLATAIHTRLYWVVLGLACVHVIAICWYAWRRDPVATSMWSGRVATTQPAIDRHHWIRALLTACTVAAVIWVAARSL